MTFPRNPQQSPTICHIGLQMQHHAAQSGYDHVAAMDQTVCRTRYVYGDADNLSVTSKITLKLLQPLLNRAGSKWYNRSSLAAELQAAKLLVAQSPCIVHFLYGENSYRYAGMIKNLPRARKSRIIATYHTPEYRTRELISNLEHMKRLDAAVAMSTVQLEFLESQVGAGRAHFIPHGVNTDYFRPLINHTNSPAAPLHCVAVGHHLRDYETLAKTMQQAQRANINMLLDVVARPDRIGPLKGLKNVRCQSGISDEELLSLYQQADLLVLPLIDATANNTLLEAMACGLPIATTNLQGVRDYVPDHGVHYIQPADADDLTAYLEHLSNDRTSLQAMGEANRERALELSWPNTRQQLQHLYRCIL